MAQIILDSNNNLIQGDFDNATLNNRTKFKTTTANATTNVYAVPNGSATSSGFTATNAADPTNASKITMATNGSTDTQIISGINGSGTYLPLSFYTNNALAMQITTGGIISAAGGGIQFPATQIPSADANTLDDYEEGTWTPVDGSGASLSFTSVSGTYVKIGRTVTCLFDLTYPSTANSSQAVIGGLPFSGTRGSMITSYSFTLTFVPLGDVGGTSCNLYGKGSNPGSTVLNSDMSTKRILGTMIYITAS